MTDDERRPFFPPEDDDKPLEPHQVAGMVILHAEANHDCRHLALFRDMIGMEGPPGETTIDGRAVHRAWRDGMLEAGRRVAPRRMAWDTLSEQDKELDEFIARRLRGGP